jgi:hypothetical protein
MTLQQKTNHVFDVHVTVHRRHSEGKEPTRCDKVQCSITQAVSQVWPPKSRRHSLIVLLMMGILVPETC